MNTSHFSTSCCSALCSPPSLSRLSTFPRLLLSCSCRRSSRRLAVFGRRLHLSLPISGRASRMTFALCRTAKESAGMQRAPPRTPVAVRGRTGMGRGRRGEVRGKKWNEIGARCALARRSRILLSLSVSVCLCLSLSVSLSVSVCLSVSLLVKGWTLQTAPFAH